MITHAQSSTRSVIFISHGGGPLPLLHDEAHKELVTSLIRMAASIEKPSAIIVISAHWEMTRPTITSANNPGLIYDYSGFPSESYAIQYPAPGNTALATGILNILQANGIEAALDDQRGFDHGVFVPLKIMYPDADTPCVQLSLINSLDPAEHINLGKALANISEQNLLIIGSGFSFHNMRAFFTPDNDQSRAMNESFEQWLNETCCSDKLDEQQREHRLINWERAPAARYCHPREEHLLPLHVCYGVAAAPAKMAITFQVLGKQASAYLW